MVRVRARARARVKVRDRVKARDRGKVRQVGVAASGPHRGHSEARGCRLTY